METEKFHRKIDAYLNTLSTPSDKLTQFCDASIIAKNALLEVDRLKSILSEIGSTKYGIHTISEMVKEALYKV